MNERDFWNGYMMGGSGDDGGSHGGGDGSWFFAVLSIIGGMVLEVMFFMLFEIDVDDVPAILLIIGWGIWSVIAAIVIGVISKR